MKISMILLASVTAWLLMVDNAWRLGPTFDEVTYLDVTASWWLADNTESITRMGSPALFYRFASWPVLLSLNLSGETRWLEEAEVHHRLLLPLFRMVSSLFGAGGILLAGLWAHRAWGGWSGPLAAWWLALSPTWLAHSGLFTMEGPLAFFWLVSCWSFARYLQRGRVLDLGLAGIGAGLAFSSKFTGILLPALMALAWAISDPPRSTRKWFERVGVMIGFSGLLIGTNLMATGLAMVTLSERVGLEHPSLAQVDPAWLRDWLIAMIERPWPQDWVGFARQMTHQGSGGSNYLWGELREHGFRHYYLVALIVKVPLTTWLLLTWRTLDRPTSRHSGRTTRWIPAMLVLFLLLVSLASSRNFGVRYLLPLWPLAMVWACGIVGQANLERWRARLAIILLAVHGTIAASVHPHELSSFPTWPGGTEAGKYILADSNLDWGQGCFALAELQADRPAYNDLTFYYFGNLDPSLCGVRGKQIVIRADLTPEHQIPSLESVSTRYVAVSRSLMWGPWGPPDHFAKLKDRIPVAITDDGTIALYLNLAHPTNLAWTSGGAGSYD